MRLAELNHLKLEELVFCLTGRDKLGQTGFRMISPAIRDRVAILTGFTVRRLARTVPTAEEAHRFERPWVTRWPSIGVTLRSAENHVPACVVCSARRKPPGRSSGTGRPRRSPSGRGVHWPCERAIRLRGERSIYMGRMQSSRSRPAGTSTSMAWPTTIFASFPHSSST